MTKTIIVSCLIIRLQNAGEGRGALIRGVALIRGFDSKQSSGYYKLREGICLIFIVHFIQELFRWFIQCLSAFIILLSTGTLLGKIHANARMNNKRFFLHFKYAHLRVKLHANACNYQSRVVGKLVNAS